MPLFAEKPRQDCDKSHEGRYYPAVVIEASASTEPGFLAINLPQHFRDRIKTVCEDGFIELDETAGPARYLTGGFEELQELIRNCSK